VRACGKLRCHQSLPAAEPRTSRAGASAAEEQDECVSLCAAPVSSLLLECVIAAPAYRHRPALCTGETTVSSLTCRSAIWGIPLLPSVFFHCVAGAQLSLKLP